MRVRITLEIKDDDYRTVETIPPVEYLFDAAITQDTVTGVQKMAAEALERHTRRHKAFDGLKHFA
jgi:hypothetical protein